MSQQKPRGTNWEQAARDRLEEVERLRAELVKLGLELHEANREIDRLRKRCEEARELAEKPSVIDALDEYDWNLCKKWLEGKP